MYFVRGGPAEPGAGKQRGDATGPSAGLLLTEPIRGLGDLIAASLLAAPGLLTAPRGDGHGVLVFPGLLAGDGSTVPLRGFLRWLGYHVRGWDLGRNHGPTETVLAGLPRALFDHAERTGRPVSLIGWSLGGVYARELARRYPRQVRQVITLGSPYARPNPSTNPSAKPWSRPIGVPSTSVYSRVDGVVAWRACVEPETATHQNVEVRCSHVGFGVDPATLWMIADRLAAPAGSRSPFRPPLALRALYPPMTGHRR
jgi:pimeloyl-ACP methyl ester carboxylesterase